MLPPTISDLETVFSSVISLALTAAGLAAFVMLIVGGFQFLTAGGDKETTHHRSSGRSFRLDSSQLFRQLPRVRFLHLLHLSPRLCSRWPLQRLPLNC